MIVPLAAGGAARAQEQTVIVESFVDTPLVTIGQRLQYSIVVRHTADVEVEIPSPGINLGGFELQEYERMSPEQTGEFPPGSVIEQRAQYTVAAFDTGTYIIPPTSIAYKTAASEQDHVFTNAVTVRVESILPGDANDILDIKEPLEITLGVLAVILFIILAAVLIGTLVYMYYRRKKRKNSPLLWEKALRLPPHEEALAALNRLRESGMLADGKIKEYYTELSDIERLYLQRRYVKPVLSMTTNQTKSELAAENINENGLRKIDRLLDACDLVKFARYRPDDFVHKDTLQLAFDIIDLTKIGEIVPGECESPQADNGSVGGHNSGMDKAGNESADAISTVSDN